MNTFDSIDIVRESADSLDEYAGISIAFDTEEEMHAEPSNEVLGFVLSMRALPRRKYKDYDALPFAGPLSWRERFDLSRWTFFGAYHADTRVGGAAVVFRAPEVELLDGRDDVALLWDIRVAPEYRHQGIGQALLRVIEHDFIQRGAKCLDVETQNINVDACRFYERHGFRLRRVNAHAYPNLPDETQFLWRKALTRTSGL